MQEKISLRALEPEDLSLLYTIENDTDLWDTSCTHGPYSKYTLKQYIASSATIYECGSQRFVISLEDATNQQIHTIGIIDLTNYAPLDSRAEVGIALLKEYRGRGFGAQALFLVEQYATKWLRIHTLYAKVLINNTMSTQLFEKAAYKNIAKLPEWHYINGKFKDIFLFMKTFSN